LELSKNLETLFAHSKTLSHGGVYFIYRPQTKLHYVGSAKVFYDRFKPRRDAKRHLGIPDTCVQDVWVSWIIVNVTPPNDWTGVKTKGNKPVNNLDAVIRALERYFYFDFKKRGHPLQGNEEPPEKGGVRFLQKAYIEYRDSKRVDKRGHPLLLFRLDKDY